MSKAICQSAARVASHFARFYISNKGILVRRLFRFVIEHLYVRNYTSACSDHP
jgi:hypothetical protein